MKKLFIVGPTASGKTNLAFNLAKKLNGDLISADSIQVYQGLTIISGKDIPPHAEQFLIKNIESSHYSFNYYQVNKIRLYGVDLVNPTYNFSVHDFLETLTIEEKEVYRLHKLPIIVGGTGFYIKACIDGIDTLEIPVNSLLRQELELHTLKHLQELLVSLDSSRFEQMNESDQKNKRRLIRAIEVAKSGYKNTVTKTKVQDKNILIVGLRVDRDVLKKRIDQRIEERIKQGALIEAQKLFKQFNTLSSPVKTANGYKQLFNFLLGKSTFDEAIDAWRNAEYLNAKKQMTWFQKDKRITWFDISDQLFEKRVTTTVEFWYNDQ